MTNRASISIIADEKKLPLITQRLNKMNFHAAGYQEGRAPEVVVIDEKKISPILLNRLSKLPDAPSVLLWHSEKFKYWPYFAGKSHFFPLTFNEHEADSLLFEALHEAHEQSRKRRRLLALRQHQNRGRSFEQNPVLHIVTQLIQECTQSETYPDILESIQALKKVLGFHDSTLILTDKNHKVTNVFLKSDDKKSVEVLPIKKKPLFQVEMAENPQFFANSDELGTRLVPYIVNPWSSGILLKLDPAIGTAKGGIPCQAYLLLLKRDLLPFTERDLWILEISLGPLILGLEKTIMFETISKASKEWRTTFDAISEPITVIDESYNIVKANRAFADLVKFDIKKIKNKKCYVLLAKRRSPCTGCPAISGNQSFGRRLSGRDRLDLIAWSYGIHTKRENYNFQFYRNVSKEAALTARLIQSEKMASLGKLVGAIAHEINNPLAGILATSQLLLADLQGNEANKSLAEDVEEIRSAATRSKKIIDNLLGFTGNLSLNEESTDVSDAIHMALTFSKSALHGIQILQKLEKDITLTKVSASSLQQVLFNLITNAAHAMHGKGSILLETSRLNSSGRQAAIRVRDNGPGIPPEHLKVIFDPFHTTKSEGKGTGLGLSIVKNLVSKMGGKISVESTVGKGTTFTIEL